MSYYHYRVYSKYDQMVSKKSLKMTKCKMKKIIN